MNGADGAFTACTGPFHINLDSAQTGIVSNFACVFGGHLSCVRGVFLGTPETALSCGTPADNLPLVVCKGYDYVVESGGDMGLAISLYLNNPFRCCSFLCHNFQGLLGCLLLVSDGLLSTFAGASVILGALTAYRKAYTMTDSAIAAYIHQSLDIKMNH